MSQSTFPSLSDAVSGDLSVAELDRFNVVMAAIGKYITGQPTEHDLFVLFPDYLDQTLTSVMESGNLSAFTQTLFLRLVVADIRSVLIPADNDTPAEEKESVYRLTALLDYFMSVIDDVPLLSKRGYTTLLTLFLSQVVVETGVMEKMNVFNHLHETLSHVPELGFIHLYNAPPTIPESLDIGMMILRSLCKGYTLPNLNLVISLDLRGEAMLDGNDVFRHLLEPDNEDLVVMSVETVIIPHLSCEEEREVWVEDLAAQGKVVFSDVLTGIVGETFESERVMKFVFRRLADIVAQVLNDSTPVVSCHGYQDIYPWLIQYRQRLQAVPSAVSAEIN